MSLAVANFGTVKSTMRGALDTRTDYIHRQELGHLLAALTPPNRLAVEISMTTGLRISDVLGLRTEALKASADTRVTVRELKTGKTRRVRIPVELYNRAMQIAGRVYVFEHRHDFQRPRTRQAVWKDLKRIARAYRLKTNIAPHSARKVYAVEAFARTRDLRKVSKLLNHSSEAVTMLYALADELTARRVAPGSTPGTVPSTR